MHIVGTILLLLFMVVNVTALQQDPNPAIPPEVAAAASEWPLANRDYSNTRAILDAEISSDNVNSLDVAWAFDIPGVGAWGGAATTPLIASGVVCFSANQRHVFWGDL